MTITCVIRYEIDPFQRDAFRQYAGNWGRIIPRCGGHLIGYFLPHEGTNDVAWGLIALRLAGVVRSLPGTLEVGSGSARELRARPDRRLILREERNFVEVVDGTLNLPSTL